MSNALRSSSSNGVHQENSATNGCWRLATIALSLAWLVLLTAGCSGSKSRTIQIESAAAATLYTSVTMNYRVDAGRLSLPMNLARPDGQQVSFQQTPSNPYPDHSLGTLSIKYPHPDGRANYALAELIIENDPSRPGATPPESGWKSWLGTVRRAARDNLPGIKLDDGVREAWALDVPRAELDKVLARLGGMGYFSPTVMAPVGVKLATKIDGGKFNKSWVQVPELDALVQRVRSEGRLVSYMRPPGQVDPFAEPLPGMFPFAGSVASVPTLPPTVPYNAMLPWQLPAMQYPPAIAWNPGAQVRPDGGLATVPPNANIPLVATNPFATPGYPVTQPYPVAQPYQPYPAQPYPAPQPLAPQVPIAAPPAMNQPFPPIGHYGGGLVPPPAGRPLLVR